MAAVSSLSNYYDHSTNNRQGCLVPKPLLFLFIGLALGSFPGLICASRDPEGYIWRDYSLIPPFTDAFDIPHWDYAGSTVVSDHYLRLTPDRQDKKGSLWNDRPCGLVQWEATFKFAATGQGTRLFGDGFAFWYTKDRMNIGDLFGNQNLFEGLGIIFDTYQNAGVVRNGQRVGAFLNDNTVSYNHDEDGEHELVATCDVEFRGLEFVYARAVYQDKLLRFYLDLEEDGNEEWMECFVVRNVELPAGYYFGFTAATGALADNHDIFSLKISEPTPMDPEEKRLLDQRIEEDIEAEEAESQHQTGEPPASGASWFWIIFLSLTAICMMGVIFMFASSKKRRGGLLPS
eukprot:UC4_evm2s373